MKAHMWDKLKITKKMVMVSCITLIKK